MSGTLSRIKEYSGEYITARGQSGRNSVDWALFSASLGLVVIGFVKRARHRLTVVEILPVIYLLVVAFWPAYQGVRLLLPMVPFFVFYMLCFAAGPAATPRVPVRFVAIGALLIALAGNYVRYYTTADFQQVPGNLDAQDSRDLFKFIQTVPSDAVVAFPKPRALTLYSGRRATAIVCPADRVDLARFVDQTGAAFFSVQQTAVACRRKFIEALDTSPAILYENDTFIVYRIRAASDLRVRGIRLDRLTKREGSRAAPLPF
ncbi:MAG: hypothetical protein H0U59_09030 [Gemmatimonadaceae bacterium]|nr:hypothetical protein [Gemmatimonadaceae bacterium]